MTSLGKFYTKFSVFSDIFLNQGICETKIFFLQNIFHKMAKNLCPPKKKATVRDSSSNQNLGASGTHILSPRKLKFQTQKL